MTVKNVGTLALIGMCAVLLSACGSKELSFSEALAVANKNSDLITQLVLWSEKPTQQSVKLETTINDGAGTIIAFAIAAQSDQDRKNQTSKIAVDFDGEVTAAEQTIATSGSLQLRMNAENMFITITKLGLKSDDPSIAMLSMMTDGLQNQRFKLPLADGQELLGGLDTYFSQLSALSTQEVDMYIETGKESYQGTFTQFHGIPAYQFTIDQEKFASMMEEVVEAINVLNSSASALDPTLSEEVPTLTADDIQIPVLEGHLLLLWKNKVAMVIETMEVVVEDLRFVASYRYGPEGIFMQMKEIESDQELLLIDIAKNKKGAYDVDIQLAELMDLQGTATLGVKKSAFTLGFDLVLHIQRTAESLPALTIPLKGSRSYKHTKSVTFKEPTTATDLNELLMGMLGMGMLDYGDDLYGEGMTDDYDRWADDEYYRLEDGERLADREG